MKTTNSNREELVNLDLCPKWSSNVASKLQQNAVGNFSLFSLPASAANFQTLESHFYNLRCTWYTRIYQVSKQRLYLTDYLYRINFRRADRNSEVTPGESLRYWKKREREREREREKRAGGETCNAEGLVRVKACSDRQVCFCQLFLSAISWNFHNTHTHTHARVHTLTIHERRGGLRARYYSTSAVAFSMLSRYHGEASYPLEKARATWKPRQIWYLEFSARNSISSRVFPRPLARVFLAVAAATVGNYPGFDIDSSGFCLFPLLRRHVFPFREGSWNPWNVLGV